MYRTFVKGPNKPLSIEISYHSNITTVQLCVCVLSACVRACGTQNLNDTARTFC